MFSNSLRRENKVIVIPKTGCFDNIDKAVIVHNESKAMLSILYCIAYTANDDS